MEINPDWIEALQCFIAAGVRFLIVGAHARARYARPRSTGDLDVWVEPTPENARRVMDALARFGTPTGHVNAHDFEDPDVVFQIGVAPVRIDILTGIDGVSFDEAWTNREHGEIQGMRVEFIGKAEFLKNKRAVGRAKDLADIEAIEQDAF